MHNAQTTSSSLELSILPARFMAQEAMNSTMRNECLKMTMPDLCHLRCGILQAG